MVIVVLSLCNVNKLLIQKCDKSYNNYKDNGYKFETEFKAHLDTQKQGLLEEPTDPTPSFGLHLIINKFKNKGWIVRTVG